ncbi:CLUMA_CG000672, isoform A [Clunio marinus]|uniref:CLUMA_CG000672, isoform A n=1 Tax=Clunio marinus TaxID=568069 RepID=A0A1J1HFP9_9DIPT|nr:CLUMA_CG000672, isoform A [Clunio marinus]
MPIKNQSATAIRAAQKIKPHNINHVCMSQFKLMAINHPELLIDKSIDSVTKPRTYFDVLYW